MSANYFCKISSSALSLDDAMKFVAGDAVGGVALFVGTARSASSIAADRIVVRLEYDAYVPMAESMLNEIANEILAAHAIERIALLHRTGVVAIGEAAIIAAASARHRAPAFDACRAAVDAVKHRLPIWKKEIYNDGGEWIGAGA